MENKDCSQCGAVVNLSEKKCGYCKAEIFVSSLAYLGTVENSGIFKYLSFYKNLLDEDKSNIEGLLGIGICFLSIGNYELSLKYFTQTINLAPYISNPYYYFSLSKIKGRRLMSMSMKEIKQIEEYLNTAIQIDNENVLYKLLLSMIKRDYYELNGLRILPPSAEELLKNISGNAINESEYDHLVKSVKISEKDFYFEKLRIE